ncbi:MAG: hypothetical protein IPK83_09805 [Planctomycetes bacterium]|nr:hypothetical protein [Planctomycetota bacterium]
MNNHADIREELGLGPKGLRRFTAYLYELLFERSERMLAVTFLLLIFVGTILLWLPMSHARTGVSLLDAFFTSTSAVCVTGLTVVDTEKDFSRFGQVVIMVLIQLGGLGIMTFAALEPSFSAEKCPSDRNSWWPILFIRAMPRRSCGAT